MFKFIKTKMMLTVLPLFFIGSLGACQKTDLAILFETHSMTSGDYRGLEIGATKESTLKNIHKLGAYAVKPIPTVVFTVTKTNVEELKQVNNVDGIRLTNYRGLAIDLYFKDKRIALIRPSVPAQGNVWFKEGEAQSDVATKLAELLNADDSLAVFPIVYYEGNGWVELKMPMFDALNILKKYGAWSFELSQEKPAGAIFEVFFSDDRLVRIEYRRSRINLN